MVYLKSRDPITIDLKYLFRSVNLDKFQFKGKLRCDHTKCVYYPLKTFRTNQGKRFGALCIPHCKKKARKSADVISVIMGKTDHVNRLKAPSFFLNCHLSSFAAVNKKTVAVIPGHQSSKPSSWKWHHTSGSQQTNI